MDTKPKICEGQMVPHAHTDDECEYQLFDSDVPFSEGIPAGPKQPFPGR